MFNRITMRDLVLLALGALVYSCAIAGQRVTIGESITRVSMIDITLLAMEAPSFTTAFAKIAGLVEFSILRIVVDLIVLTCLLMILTWIWSSWNDHGKRAVVQERRVRRGLSMAAQVLSVMLVALLAYAVFEAKLGFSYAELRRIAALETTPKLDGRYQIAPPRPGEKTTF
ncbi:MAG: hypothetical protein C0458_25775 [Methylobacterium sp.]|jgi:hypothetical protein|uniref:hypothetical protein n=1 Tax=Methylobacterium sp. CCH7-A2 TaxID=1768789 RepID=UPI00082FBEE7|nr:MULTISPECIES: hypothetical protein [Hyphomicrobiales]MBA4224153.1 hypothetical protein [Methylobacterium sp.]